MSIYIVFASWEDRFIKGIENDIDSRNIDKIYCFYFKDDKFYNRTEEKISHLKSLAENKNIAYQDVALKFDEYIDSWMKVKEEFSTMTFDGVAQLNISTMPRNMIFCMLYFLKGKQYEVSYYPANKIGKNPTTNPSTPHIVLQHGGIMHPEKETMLVAFVGHDRKRVYQLYNYFEPFKTKLIKIKHEQHYSPPPGDYKNNFSDISNIEEIEIASPSSKDAFSKLNEELTTKILKKYNILICSLGPKIQSLGIYKFHQLHNEVALLYSPSKDYADDYSTGIKLEDLEEETSSWINP